MAHPINQAKDLTKNKIETAFLAKKLAEIAWSINAFGIFIHNFLDY